VKRAYRLVERDEEILRAVGRLMYASTDNLAKLFFGNLGTCSRRLAKLLSLGLLAVRVPRRDGPNVYRLTKRGLDHLVEADVEVDDLHLGGREHGDDLGHTLLGNEFRVRLVAAVRKRDDITIERLLSDADLRRAAEERGVAPSYIPDLLVRLRKPAGVVGLVVEVDTGSESVRYFARHKARELARLRAQNAPVWGLSPWRPLVIVPTERRLRLLARAVVEEGGGALWLAGALDHFRERDVLRPVFATMGDIHAVRKSEPLTFTRELVEPAPRVP
jgi:hypothetical protein